MTIGLFIPCYIDQLYPQVGIATLAILENLDLDVVYPMNQTCCGQPMANTGCIDDAKDAARNHVAAFAVFDCIVCPSGSCVSFVRNHYDLLEQTAPVIRVRQNTFELCEFLVDVMKIDRLEARFPYKVGLHNCCHGHRELRLARSSETIGPAYSKTRRLLEMVADLELVELQRPDECCGFGGTFAVKEAAVSSRMGLDRIADHEQAGAQVITGIDMSCLMHLEGLIKREEKAIRVKHIAEILAGENYAA